MPMRPPPSRGWIGRRRHGRKLLMTAWILAGDFRRSTRSPVPVDAVDNLLQFFFFVGDVGMRWREGPLPSGECQFISSRESQAWRVDILAPTA